MQEQSTTVNPPLLSSCGDRSVCRREWPEHAHRAESERVFIADLH